MFRARLPHKLSSGGKNSNSNNHTKSILQQVFRGCLFVGVTALLLFLLGTRPSSMEGWQQQQAARRNNRPIITTSTSGSLRVSQQRQQQQIKQYLVNRPPQKETPQELHDSTFFAPHNRDINPHPIMEPLPASNTVDPTTEHDSSHQLLPDWRLSVDCSVFDFFCVAQRQSTGLYEDYPFPLGHRRERDFEDLDYTLLQGVPAAWQSELRQNHSLLEPPSRPILYNDPPRVSFSVTKQCLTDAQTLSWQEQLDRLMLGGGGGGIAPDEDTNLLAFTISDIAYAKDMIHEVFEMNDAVVDLEGAFFLVAIDYETLELCCRYGYPVVAWPTAVLNVTGVDESENDKNQFLGTEENVTAAFSSESMTREMEEVETRTNSNSNSNPAEDALEALKHSVANTKFEVSLALVERQKDFFFYEMDLWFLKSPKPLLSLFQDDILLSSHQNCPMCANIGVYLVRANKHTLEYFQTAIALAKESYNTHDQWIMAQLMQMENPKFEFGKGWDPVPERVPRLRYPVKAGYFSPHEIVASERPYASSLAIAIHPLRESPLKDPHGKKMLAKEMGAWYGYRRGSPNNDGGGVEESSSTSQAGQAGYYHRQGVNNRRYLWMDGHLLNGYSDIMNFEFDPHEAGLYHNTDNLKWTMAALLALARRTGRIFILPRMLQGRGIHFLWNHLDLESVEQLGIDYRETSFPNNPKAWSSSNVPFETVARTALGDLKKDGTMFVETSHFQQDGAVDSKTTQAWKFVPDTNSTQPMDQTDAVDAWWALHTALPEVDMAELLLPNTHFLNMHYHRPLSGRARKRDILPDDETGRGRAEFEIASVYHKLRWCLSKDDNPPDKVVGVIKSSDDCYGRGKF